MYVVIVGAGRTGRHVIQSAVNDDQEVLVFEKDESRAQWVSANMDCFVSNSDASSLEKLRDAEVNQADAMIATTNDDAVNLMVMMLGKELGVKRLISSVTDDEHLSLFDELGIATVGNPFRLNGQFLYRTLQRPGVKDFMDLGNGAEIIEITVNEGAPLIHKDLQEINEKSLLPKESLVVAIKRKEKLIVPDGNTEIHAGDLVTLFTREGVTRKLLNQFN
jgi:trk system potassium uptake protein TrkA